MSVYHEYQHCCTDNNARLISSIHMAGINLWSSFQTDLYYQFADINRRLIRNRWRFICNQSANIVVNGTSSHDRSEYYCAVNDVFRRPMMSGADSTAVYSYNYYAIGCSLLNAECLFHRFIWNSVVDNRRPSNSREALKHWYAQ